MGKIIVQKQKHGDVYYDASTKEKEAQAFKKMFKNNEEMEYYHQYDDESFQEEKQELEEEIKKTESLDVSSVPSSMQDRVETAKRNLGYKRQELLTLIREKELYDLAKKGDAQSMQRLIERRKDGEYEGWSFEKLL